MKRIYMLIVAAAVSAGALLCNAAPAAAPAIAQTAVLSSPEGETVSVVLVEVGANKVKVIKILRSWLEIELKDAYDLVNSTPVTLKSEVPAEEAAKIKASLEEVGAKVELKKK